jgi:hypothetical protein
VCVVLAALAIPLSVSVLWAANSINDQSTFVSTLAPLAKDKTVTSTVTDDVTSALLSLDSQSPVRVPPALVRSGTATFVEGASFPVIWTAALRAAYPTVHALSTGQLGQGQPVVVNLTPAVDAVVSALRTQDHGALHQPSSTVTPQVAVTLVPSSRVATVSRVAHDLLNLEWILPLSAVAAVLTAWFLARRRTVVGLGLAICTGVACIALLRLLAVLRTGVANESRGDSGLSAASVSALDALSGPLRFHLYITIAIAVTVALGVLAWWIARPVLRGSARRNVGRRGATGLNRYRV